MAIPVSEFGSDGNQAGCVNVVMIPCYIGFTALRSAITSGV